MKRKLGNARTKANLFCFIYVFFSFIKYKLYNIIYNEYFCDFPAKIDGTIGRLAKTIFENECSRNSRLKFHRMILNTSINFNIQ